MIFFKLFFVEYIKFVTNITPYELVFIFYFEYVELAVCFIIQELSLCTYKVTNTCSVLISK